MFSRLISKFLLPLALLVVFAMPAMAQQTGSVVGKVTDANGGALPGVTVDARSNVLPGPRTTVTAANGTYQLPALPPGAYSVTFTMSGMQTVKRDVQVQLGLDISVDTKMAVQGVSDTVTVRATASLVDRQSSSVTSGISAAQIDALPVGQQYQDIVKLIPGVQYTQDAVRGPSAGASGQSNVYKFDGVNVTLPLFGTLSAEPAAHDIEQVTIIKGGAKAMDFNRAAGFQIDSVSKSGTSQFTGLASYQFQTSGMSAGLTNGSLSRFQENRYWWNADAGGPIVKDHLFFYGSYYRPEVNRASQANLSGPIPNYQSNRDEGYGKLTLTPKSGILINGSFRDSHRLDNSALFSSNQAPTSGTGNEAWLRIGSLDGSWVINSKSFATFKATHFANETQGVPDNAASVAANPAIGAQLNINNLAQQGLLTVPAIGSNPAINAFILPYVNQFGYQVNGVATGGGLVGVGATTNKQNFYHTSGEGSYNYTASVGATKNEFHVGFQKYTDTEDLLRTTNGWGSISIPAGGGNKSCSVTSVCSAGTAGLPVYFQAAFAVQGFGPIAPTLHSEYRSQNFEFNDQITHKNVTINVGLIDSRDQLWGQGLMADTTAYSGFRLSTSTTTLGRRYMEYESMQKMIQPRMGITWAYDGTNTLWMSYSKSNPAVSSLPRAASWDRNLSTTVAADFDQNGVLFAIEPTPASSGKLFVPNMNPPREREFMAGTSQKISNSWSMRFYGRVRKGDHFWEDTNNTARTAFAPPPGTVPALAYITDLTQRLNQITSGSTYVIAELDNAFTKYWEVTAESEWHSRKVFANVSYTRSHYYGNFDQDDSASTLGLNDSNIFVGSSNIGDGAGHQLWDNKLGTLHADRPNVVKAWGTYLLNWNGSFGAFLTAQSGQAWEAWSYLPYTALSTSTSETIKYAEPAGSRRTAGHAQVDINYTQNVNIDKTRRLQFIVEVFNLTNSQTGYNPDPHVHSGTSPNPLFGVNQSFFDPRRVQGTIKFIF